MSDREKFMALLDSNGVQYGERSEREGDGIGDLIVVITIVNHQEMVNTFSHCFCEFTFETENRGGALRKISYGY